jgi:hypothetical protein
VATAARLGHFTDHSALTSKRGCERLFDVTQGVDGGDLPRGLEAMQHALTIMEPMIITDWGDVADTAVSAAKIPFPFPS